MNNEQVLLNGQLENEDQTSVSTMAGNDALAESGVSDTSGFLSEKIRSMITAPDFRHSDPYMSERDIQRRSAQPWIAPQDYEVARGSTFAQNQTSDRWTIAKDAAKRFGMEMLTLGNKAEIVAGQLLSKTGSTIGEEMQKRAYDVLDSQMAQIGRTYENVEDLNTWTSDIISGAGSMLELFAVGLATGGTGALAIQGIDAMGGGTYNNMRKYADEHDGSIEGFEGNWTDIGIDLANATLQVAIEKYLGFGRKDLFAPLGKKRWFKGALDKFAKEAVAGAFQEGAQALSDDIGEYAKGNIDVVDNWQGYMRAAVLGGIMQGALAGAMQKFSRVKADAVVEEMATSAMLAKEPNANISDVKKKAKSFAQKFNDDVEDGLVKNMWDEFADRMDANNDRGKVRDKLVSEFTKARVAALGLESADELDADDLADIQDAATVAAGEALRESFTQGKPIEQTLTARLVADGKDLIVRDLTPEERGVREVSRVDLQADEDALAQQIGTARESLARARLETELQAQQTALEEERARRKADVEELQSWAEQQVRLGEEIGRRRERGQTEFSLREINRWLRQSSRSEQARAREERKAGQVRERKKEIAQKPLPKEQTPETEPTKVKPAETKTPKKTTARVADTTPYLFQQSLQNVAKGVVSDTGRGAYNSRYQRIILNKDSDVSTILHELSHMWLNNWFKAYRAENAPESFRKWWRPVERALGIRESDRFLDQDASEKFARSFEKWVLDGGKGAESSLAPVYERLSKRLADIYDDLATRYFDMVADLKPEVQSWFAKNESLADSMVVDVPERNEETGETTTEQVRVQYRDRAAERETAQKMAETEEKAERTADRAADEINEITENVAGEQLAPDSDEPAQSPYTAEGQKEQRTSKRIVESAKADGVLLESRKYDPMMSQRAAEDAVVFATADLDSAFEVAMGRKNAPGDVPRIAVFFAVQNKLMLNPKENAARLQELALNSPVIEELSRAGQQLRMAGVALSKDSPVRILRDLSKMYDENLTDAERASITENINKINDYIARADLNTEDVWNKILSDMECK